MTSLYLVSWATQMLKTPPGLLAVWANARPLLEGAVPSCTTFHTLPSPLPVFSAFQPEGTLPTSPLLNWKLRTLSSAASSSELDSSATSAAIMIVTRRIVRSP